MVSNAQTGSLLLARDDGSLFIAAGRDLLDKYIGSRVELDKKQYQDMCLNRRAFHYR